MEIEGKCPLEAALSADNTFAKSELWSKLHDNTLDEALLARS
jgi:hypothetical protein